MKFPITHQHDSMQCGIACLQMICKYFGREYSLDFLSKVCSVTTQGVSRRSSNLRGLHETRLTENHTNTVHEEWYINHSMQLCFESLKFRI